MVGEISEKGKLEKGKLKNAKGIVLAILKKQEIGLRDELRTVRDHIRDLEVEIVEIAYINYPFVKGDLIRVRDNRYPPVFFEAFIYRAGKIRIIGRMRKKDGFPGVHVCEYMGADKYSLVKE